MAIKKKIIADLGKYNPYSRSVPILASTPDAVEGVDPAQGAALTKWDLSRFMKNPVILWNHNTDDATKKIPVGLARDVEDDQPIGLKMRVYFASAAANELAEQLAHCVEETLVRAVSVGYDYDETTGIATLNEVSFVPIGLDENAGTPALNPEAANVPETDEPDEETAKKTASTAGRALAMHRQRALRTRAKLAEMEKTMAIKTDAAENELKDGEVLRMDRSSSRLGKLERTPQGGAFIPARLTRTGVLTYTNPDGSKRRELRLAEEVFKADSLKTLEHATVIDIKDHTGMVTPKTWKEATLGHVAVARQDAQDPRFVSSRILVQHGETLDAIDNGDRTEISCGYRCRLDMTPGVHDGEAYDCIQRDISYNHVALCPPNRGRAGPEVGLRLDTNAPPWGVTNLDTNEGDQVMKIRFNGKEYEAGSTEHMDAVEAHTNATVEKTRLDAKTEIETIRLDTKTKLDAAKAAIDKAEGERDAAKQTLETERADAKKMKDEEMAKKSKDEADSKFKKKARRTLERLALRFFTDDEGKDDKDGKKLDALEEKIDGMSDRELRVHCIGKSVENFDASSVEKKSDDYIEARFDSLIEQITEKSRINGAVQSMQIHREHLDSNSNRGLVSPIVEAQRKRDEAAHNAGRPGAAK